MTAESAQPGKTSNVTRPFPILWVGSGDETKFLVKSHWRGSTIFESRSSSTAAITEMFYREKCKFVRCSRTFFLPLSRGMIYLYHHNL